MSGVVIIFAVKLVTCLLIAAHAATSPLASDSFLSKAISPASTRWAGQSKKKRKRRKGMKKWKKKKRGGKNKKSRGECNMGSKDGMK